MSQNTFSMFPNERFIDLNIYQFGYEQCSPLHSFGPFVRNHYLFHYIISGKGTLLSTYQNQLREYKLEKDMGFLICPNTINHYFADENDPWEYTWVEFDGMKVKEFLDQSGVTFKKPIYHPNSIESDHKLRDLILYIAHHSNEPPLHLIGYMYLILNQLIQSSSSKHDVQSGKLSDFYIKEAISFIEQNYMRNITVENMAQFCNLNRSYFGKIFHDNIGKSPQQFLISYRMGKAADQLKTTATATSPRTSATASCRTFPTRRSSDLDQLKTTDLPIKDICENVGYPNQLHFSRAFKNTYGISPSEYRKQNHIIKKDDE